MIARAPFAGGGGVRAVSGAGRSTALGTIADLSATAGDTQVTLSWTAAANATSHQPQYRATGSGTWLDFGAALGGSATGVTVTGLVNGTGYEFRVTATDGSTTTASNTVTGTPAALGDFQLASGHYEPRVSPMRIIHPRPDADTATAYVYRNAYPGMAWELPVCVQGGSWPFEYAITDDGGATGLSIGQQHGSANYGIMSWASPVAGSYSVTVRVRDQEYGRGGGSESEVTATFTLVVSASNFAFFDATNGSNTTGDGTLANPYQNFRVWDDDSTTVQGQVCVHRTGTYEMDTGVTIWNGSNYLWTDNTPRVFMAYPGEAVSFDFQPGYWAMGRDECAFLGIQFEGIHGATGTGHEQYIRSTQSRQLWYDCIWTQINGASNAESGANATLVFKTNFGTGSDWAMHSCTIDGPNGYDIMLVYDCMYGLFENNLISEYSGGGGHGHGVFLKAGTSLPRYWTIRNNRTPDGVTIDNHLCRMDRDSTDEAGGRTNEFCWNNIQADSFDGPAYCQLRPNEWGPTFYRNTLRNPAGVSLQIDFAFSTGNYGVDVTRNVFVHDGSDADGVGIDNPSFGPVNQTENLEGVAADGIVDSDGKLQGSYRTTYLGTRGHEVS